MLGGVVLNTMHLDFLLLYLFSLLLVPLWSWVMESIVTGCFRVYSLLIRSVRIADMPHYAPRNIYRTRVA